MAILPIRTYPDPVLRVECSEVTRFAEDLRRLVDDMVATMHAAPGIGLAASQVGVEVRVAVVDLSTGEDPSALRILVNPRLDQAEGKEVEVEGCLSIPDLSDRVERPARLRVRAQDAAGDPWQEVVEGWLARAICHEVDHLDGVLFVDRLRGLRRERARRHLKRMARQQEKEGWREPQSASGP